MSKIKFALRWASTFTVLSAFTFISLGNAFSTEASALAANYENLRPDLQGEEQYLAIEGDGSTMFNKNKIVCVLDQSQLKIAQSKFGAEVTQAQTEGSGIISVASIQKSREANQGKIFSSLNLNANDCMPLKDSRAFYFYLAPGVS